MRVKEVPKLFNCIKGEPEVMGTHEYVQDVLFINGEDAAKLGLKGKDAIDAESAP